MRKSTVKSKQGVANKLFAKNCICCYAAVANNKNVLCDRCTEELYSEDTSKTENGIISLLPYEKPQTRALILYMKDHKDEDAFRFCASLIAHRLIADSVKDLSAFDITFAPRRPISRLVSGFDQSEQVARALAFELFGDRKRCVDLLSRNLFSGAQKLLTSKQREKNMKRNLHIKRNKVIAKNLIVIDDVCTTGATLNRVCDLLYAHGAENVIPISIAYR